MNKVTLVIIVFFILLALGFSFVYSNTQHFTICIVDENGSPLKNVDIQGVIPVPPNMGSRWETLFIGRTDERGEFILTDLTKVRSIISKWINYLGDKASVSYPNIILFLTYNCSGLYVDQASIRLNPIEIMDGKSYALTKVIHINRKPDAPAHPRVVKVERLSDAIIRRKHNEFNVFSYLPPSKPSVYSPYHIWVMIGDYIWPSTGYGKIPIAWIESSSVFGSLSVGIVTYHSTNFNIGYAIESTGTTFKAGATLWSVTGHFSKSYEFPEQGDTGYIYIKGKIEAARYQLAYVDQHGDIVYYLDVYQDDIAIVDLNMDGSEILGGIEDGFPPQINYIDDEFSYEYYTHDTGTGSIYGDYAYHIHSDDFVDTYAASDYTWIDLAAAAGSILLWVSGGDPVAGIAVGVLSKLVASISSSYIQISYADVDYDSYNRYDIYVYVRVGSTNYIMSNGEEGRIPLMGIKIIGYPQYPGGPS